MRSGDTTTDQHWRAAQGVGFVQLLPSLHQGVCAHCITTHGPAPGPTLSVEWDSSGGVQATPGRVGVGASAGIAQPNGTVQGLDRCVGGSNWGSVGAATG